ncbi:MAG: DsrE family protein [Nitrospirae bacterium]|nr:DsrE family protein [Nitrospirota bacterium]
MNCSDVRTLIFAFVDNELDVATSLKVQAHLDRCAECATRADFEIRFQEHLREQVKPCRLPKAGRRRILAALRDPVGAGRWYAIGQAFRRLNRGPLWGGVVGAALALVAGAFLFSAQETPAQQKVVYHFNQGDLRVWKAGLMNISNHLESAGPERARIVAVLHGPSLDIVNKGKSQPEVLRLIEELKARGVLFRICHNTVNQRKIDWERDLYDCKPGDLVPSGVAEIARLQQLGYAYIRI